MSRLSSDLPSPRTCRGYAHPPLPEDLRRKTVRVRTGTPLLLLLTGLLITTSGLRAQNSRVDTFYITAAVKTEAHPYYGMGHERGYVVNGVEGDTIYLVRDSTYVFNISAVPQNLPMLFYTIPIGGTSGIFEAFITKRYVSEGITIVKPTDETPETMPASTNPGSAAPSSWSIL